MANLGVVSGRRLIVCNGYRQGQAQFDAGPLNIGRSAVHGGKGQAAIPALDRRPPEEQADAQARGRLQGLAPGEGVQGTVQHSGSSLRISAQLVDTTDGSQLWSLRFDRASADVFALEDDIAQQVACAVCRTLLGTGEVDASGDSAAIA